MLKSMKQKFGGKKSTSSERAERHDPPSATPPARQGAAGQSTSSRPVNSGLNSAVRAFSSGREKPAQPALTPANLTLFYGEALPAFKDVPNAEKQNLFVKKLHLCAFTFDFTDGSKDVREKEVKRQTLVELLDFVSTEAGKFTESVSDDVMFMISSNLFRALPTKQNEHDTLDPDEEEASFEPAWLHLQIVYEFLLRYIVSNDTDARAAKKYINQSFVVRMLELFDSEDPRERDYLKTILHRIYGKFMIHRLFVRKAINNVFYKFIWETEKHSGIAELLEILGSIINGFALPLKDEHKTFLMRALLPLHKPKCAGRYHQQLSYCVTQFVDKDPKLAEPVLRAVLKYWPVTNSQKEVLFLGEIEEILETTQAQEFALVVRPLFAQLSKCISSWHFQVAERTLFFWNNEYIVQLITQNRSVILPLIFGSLEGNLTHWNPAVVGLTKNVRDMFNDMDKDLFEECRARYQREQSEWQRHRQKLDLQWEHVESLAAANTNSLGRIHNLPSASSTPTDSPRYIHDLPGLNMGRRL